VLDEYLADDVSIIAGGARGADTLAFQWALDVERPVTVVPARWRQHGKAAGHIRNQQMIDMEPDLVVACPGGRGTTDCINRAIKAGIPVRYVE